MARTPKRVGWVERERNPSSVVEIARVPSHRAPSRVPKLRDAVGSSELAVRPLAMGFAFRSIHPTGCRPIPVVLRSAGGLLQQNRP